jgi:hypothetical protein
MARTNGAQHLDSSLDHRKTEEKIMKLDKEIL